METMQALNAFQGLVDELRVQTTRSTDLLSVIVKAYELAGQEKYANLNEDCRRCLQSVREVLAEALPKQH